MNVRQLMSSPATSCSPDDSLSHAAHLLWEHDCGMLPVVDRAGRLGATITDRDVCMGAYTKGRRLGELRVADSMSHRLVTCRDDDSIATAARTMIDHRVRRLPVVDADGKLCGVLSLNDLARAAPKDPAVGREVLQILTAVCTKPAAVPAPGKAAAQSRSAETGGQP